MPNPDVLLIVGLAAAAIGALLFFRFKRYRKQLIIAGLIGGAAAAFVTWYVMFRVDDPTFTADRDKAEQTQRALDEALGDSGFDDLDDLGGAGENATVNPK